MGQRSTCVSQHQQLKTFCRILFAFYCLNVLADGKQHTWITEKVESLIYWRSTSWIIIISIIIISSINGSISILY